MPRTKDRTHIYGEVDSPEDIRRINREIRKEMEAVTKRDQLTELKKRSDYLCTLAEAPSWKEKFGNKIDEIMAAAKEEDRDTTELANQIAHCRGWDADYDAWGGR